MWIILKIALWAMAILIGIVVLILDTLVNECEKRGTKEIRVNGIEMIDLLKKRFWGKDDK